MVEIWDEEACEYAKHNIAQLEQEGDSEGAAILLEQLRIAWRIAAPARSLAELQEHLLAKTIRRMIASGLLAVPTLYAGPVVPLE